MAQLSSIVIDCDKEFRGLDANINALVLEIENTIDNQNVVSAENASLIESLKKQLLETQIKLEATEALRDTCAASLESLAAIAASTYDSAKSRSLLSTASKESKATVDAQLERLRAKNDKFEAALEALKLRQEQEARVELAQMELKRQQELDKAEMELKAQNERRSQAISLALSKAGGFGIFIRIRCQEADEKKTTLKNISKDSLQIKSLSRNAILKGNDMVTIWNDNDTNACKAVKGLSFLTELDLINYEATMYTDVNGRRLAGGALTPNKVKFDLYYELKRLAPFYAAMANRKNELQPFKSNPDFQKTGFKLFLEFEAKHAEFYKSYAGQEQRQDVLVSLQTDIENIKAAETYLIQSGNMVVGQEKSVLNFLLQDEFPATVTIFAIGGSGSGKTTSARSILQRLFFKYMERADASTTITLSYRQIFQNKQKDSTTNTFNETIIQQLLPIHEPEKKKPTGKEIDFEDYSIYLKPYLLLPQNLPKTSSTVKLFPIDGMTDKEMMKMAAWCNMLQYDATSDKYRRTLYTPHNPTGSSRSIKISTLDFATSSQQNRIHLVDTCGYEHYDQADLITFFNKQISTAKVQDENYDKLVASEAAKGREGLGIVYDAVDLSHRVLKEGEFIRNSLNYIQDSIVEFRHSIPEEFEATTRQTGATIKNQWIEDQKLITKNCSVLVVGAFKHFIPEEEAQAGVDTIEFLNAVSK